MPKSKQSAFSQVQRAADDLLFCILHNVPAGQGRNDAALALRAVIEAARAGINDA